MDLITLAMAKKYTDEQRLGYSAYDIGSTVNFDGTYISTNTIPGETLGVSGIYAYASSMVFTGGVALYAKGAKEVQQGIDILKVSNLRVDVSDDGIWMLFGDLMGNRLLALSFGNDIAQALGVSAGTYVWKETISGVDYWVCEIQGHFTETIHTIDPKFIPGAVLAVVELSTTFQVGKFFTEEESKALSAAYERGMPLVAKINVDLGAIGKFVNCAMVWHRAQVDDSSGPKVFIASFGTNILQIAEMNGGWVCGSQTMG